MNTLKKRLLMALLLVLVVSLQMSAAFVSVKARLDSVSVLMGELTTLRVEVTRQAGAPGLFPQFSRCEADGYVSFSGDSVEMRRPKLADSTVNGGREVLRYDIPVQVFDSGYYQLPEILYVSGGDTARSQRLGLKVIPVNVTANDSISPLAPVMAPEGSSVFDWVPDFLVDFWWVIVLVALAVLAGLWAMRRYKREGTILPRKPLPTPYAQAIDRLHALNARKLWEKGMEKEYFTELTDILRVYLYRRFKINAMEMTSRQIMETLSENPSVKDKRDYMRNILNMADFVKFAKVRPLPADNVAAYDNAVKFVEETRPAPEEEQAMLEAEMEALRPAEPVRSFAGSRKNHKMKQHPASSRRKKGSSKKGGAK